ncbi:MAG: hypothetical protein K5984_01120, partial [Bacteroidales bacterium]|nr:hypothetical protein [Bacteroidales bacterium]
MKIPALTPRIGKDTLSVGNNEKLVVNEHFGKLPKGPVQSVKYGIYFICTSGQAELDYAGQRLEIHKGDLFLYCAYNIMDNIQTSADFDCREIWFTREAMWDINMLSKKSLYDIVSLIRYPKVTLSKDEKSLLDDYYKLLCHRMRDDAKMMQDDIVQTIFSALALEILCIVRRGYEKIIQAQNEGDGNTLCINTLRGKQLADRYIKLVEDSDGRIRRV